MRPRPCAVAGPHHGGLRQLLIHGVSMTHGEHAHWLLVPLPHDRWLTGLGPGVGGRCPVIGISMHLGGGVAAAPLSHLDGGGFRLLLGGVPEPATRLELKTGAAGAGRDRSTSQPPPWMGCVWPNLRPSPRAIHRRLRSCRLARSSRPNTSGPVVASPQCPNGCAAFVVALVGCSRTRWPPCATD